ncbi:MAG: diadenylate cyclase CdaA [Clostridia bacterium]|nr:diadenylate cyclase CdaA [Clostridia bacterium]
MPKSDNIFVNLWNDIKEYILYPFSEIRFIDIIDILILMLVFYAFYHFIKNRRAGKLMTGLLLIIALLVASTAFEMYAIKFVLQNFYQVGILAIIIVFQPELRAALEKVGNTPLSGLRNIGMNEPRDVASITSGIDSICEAVCDMSLYKTGALIVIERSVKLGEYIKPSNEISAKMSSRLLQNLFYDKAPFHDGAVIVRDMHVYAAGCVLPLSSNESIDNSLGTRHRAAIGISEVSDAIAIVVSEETGTISITCEGRISRNYNYNSLKHELLNLLIHNAQHVRKNIKSEDSGRRGGAK